MTRVTKTRMSCKVFQTIVAYISVGTVLFLGFFVIVFHVYRCGSAKIYSLGQATRLGKMMPRDQTSHDLNQDHLTSSLSQFMDAIDRPRERYNPPLLEHQNGPGCVSLPSSDDQAKLEYLPITILKAKNQPSNCRMLEEKSAEKSHGQKHMFPRVATAIMMT